MGGIRCAGIKISSQFPKSTKSPFQPVASPQRNAEKTHLSLQEASLDVFGSRLPMSRWQAAIHRLAELTGDHAVPCGGKSELSVKWEVVGCWNQFHTGWLVVFLCVFGWCKMNIINPISDLKICFQDSGSAKKCSIFST